MSVGRTPGRCHQYLENPRNHHYLQREQEQEEEEEEEQMGIVQRYLEADDMPAQALLDLGGLASNVCEGVMLHCVR